MEKSSKKHTVYLLAGGNLDNTRQKYDHLFALLENHVGTIVRKSAFYRSAAWGYQSPHPYINVAICVSTFLSPHDLLHQTQHIETLMGRTQKSTQQVYQDRTMDIDILLYDDLVLTTDDLIIPHPRLVERDFVLTPLTEIAPNVLHPLRKKNIKQLRAEQRIPRTEPTVYTQVLQVKKEM